MPGVREAIRIFVVADILEDGRGRWSWLREANRKSWNYADARRRREPFAPGPRLAGC
jgi:hypothetical protein